MWRMARDGKSGNGTAQPSDFAARLLSERQVAERLNIGEVTLQQWRARGKGPPFVRLGRTIRYREADIEAWLIPQEVVPAQLGSELAGLAACAAGSRS